MTQALAHPHSLHILLIGLLSVGLIYVGGTESSDYYTEKPAFLESCYIYKPDFTNCSTRSTQKFIENVANGNEPKFAKKFGSLDPLAQDQLTFNQDNNDIAAISTNLTELQIRGLKNLQIKENRVSKKDFGWQTKAFIPKLRIDGKYQMIGRILIVPLNGAGSIFIELDDLNILMHTKTHLYEKGGYTFYNVTEVQIELEISKLRTYMDNLFNGHSKDVERSTNQFFNENWRDFYAALKPLIVETVERTLLDLLQKLFHLVPANFFVADIPTSLSLYGRKTQMIA